ncbi:MAG: acetoacetate--CoA ligase, partial [Candidatus Promineifilaceae bacterium]
RIRTELSPRHTPDQIFAIQEVPYTLSGKKMEVPIRRILLGQPVETAVNIGAMRNPEAIDYFIALSAKLQ